jgi:hypothetical protein
MLSSFQFHRRANLATNLTWSTIFLLVLLLLSVHWLFNCQHHQQSHHHGNELLVQMGSIKHVAAPGEKWISLPRQSESYRPLARAGNYFATWLDVILKDNHKNVETKQESNHQLDGDKDYYDVVVVDKKNLRTLQPQQEGPNDLLIEDYSYYFHGDDDGQQQRHARSQGRKLKKNKKNKWSYYAGCKFNKNDSSRRKLLLKRGKSDDGYEEEDDDDSDRDSGQDEFVNCLDDNDNGDDDDDDDDMEPTATPTLPPRTDGGDSDQPTTFPDDTSPPTLVRMSPMPSELITSQPSFMVPAPRTP